MGMCAQAVHRGGDSVRGGPGSEGVHVLVQRAQMGRHAPHWLRRHALLPHRLREAPYIFPLQGLKCCMDCEARFPSSGRASIAP